MRFIARICLTFALMAATVRSGPLPSEVASRREALDPVVVTGTRLPGPASLQTNSLLRIERPEFEAFGAGTTGELLQRLPMNSGGTPTLASPVALNGPVPSVNFRGLGARNVLILLDGRRVAPNGQSDPVALYYDVGTLPTAAVESIEVLRDGASAVYGADAVSGVVNVRLRRGWEGATFQAGYEQLDGTDWGRQTASLAFGRKYGAWSVLVTAEATRSAKVLFGDRPWSRTEDRRAWGSQDFRQNFGYPGQLTLPAGAPGIDPALLGGPITPGTLTAGGVVRASPGVFTSPAQFVRLPGPITGGRPTPGDSTNAYNRLAEQTLLPGETSDALNLQLARRIGDAAEVFTQLGWARRVLDIQLHATPAGTLLESAPGVGDGPGGAIILPARSPYNPFGVDVGNLRFQVAELGPRLREFTTRTPRALFGARGRTGDETRWETAVLHTESIGQERTGNYILDRSLQDGLSGRLGGYLNPFGPSDPGVIDRARTSITIDRTTRLSTWDAQVSTRLWQGPWGPVRVAVGGEARREDFEVAPDAVAGRGGTVAWASITPADYARTTTSGYVETSLPLFSGLSVQLAGRIEHFGDYGTATSPKVALAWTPATWITLRLTGTDSFKAPELIDLFSGSTEIYTNIIDPRRPDLGTYAVRLITGANPGLEAETTRSGTVGVALRPKPIRGLEVGVDAWRLESRNLISSIGLNTLLALETAPGFNTAAYLTRSPPNGNLPGELVLVRDTRTNVDLAQTQGLDLHASYSAALEGWTVTTRTEATWLDSFTFTRRTAGTTEFAGLGGRPRWRAQGYIMAERASWSGSLSMEFIGRNEGSGVAFDGGDTRRGTWYSLNPTLTRKWAGGWSVAVGARNVLNREPPKDYGSAYGYDPSLYDGRGRSYWLRVARSF